MNCTVCAKYLFSHQTYIGLGNGKWACSTQCRYIALKTKDWRLSSEDAQALLDEAIALWGETA